MNFPWVRENCKDGFDKNLGKNLPPVITKSKIVPADKDWEFIVKMTLIIRDILYGNPRLDEMGWHEEALGRNAVVGGFQGQRQWTDWLPNADFTEAIMASTFDWNGPKAPTPFATENDTCNGIAMMLGSLVSGSAPCFHDVRTYWSPEACERVTGQKPDGVAANGFIHLINSGATALDGSGACVDAEGNHVMKPFWEMTDADIKACLNATDWCRADYEYFRGGGYSSHFRCKAEMPVTMLRFNIVEGIGPVLQIAEGWTADLPDEIHNTIDKRTDPTWPTTWFCPRLTGQGAFTDVYSVMANWGANHGVTVYGHVGADLITLASMLRMQEQCDLTFTQRFFVRDCRRGAPGQMPGVRLPGSDEADDAETALVGAAGVGYFALHGPPRYCGKGIACKVRVGQIPLHRPQIAENDDVIIFAGRQILLVQKLVDKVVVLVGKNTLSIIQRNIVHKAPPS